MHLQAKAISELPIPKLEQASKINPWCVVGASLDFSKSLFVPPHFSPFSRFFKQKICSCLHSFSYKVLYPSNSWSTACHPRLQISDATEFLTLDVYHSSSSPRAAKKKEEEWDSISIARISALHCDGDHSSPVYSTVRLVVWTREGNQHLYWNWFCILSIQQPEHLPKNPIFYFLIERLMAHWSWFSQVCTPPPPSPSPPKCLTPADAAKPVNARKLAPATFPRESSASSSPCIRRFLEVGN